VLVIAGGKPIFVELNSRRGVASEAQKQVRAELIPADAEWRMARSARAALTALHLLDVAIPLPTSRHSASSATAETPCCNPPQGLVLLGFWLADMGCKMAGAFLAARRRKRELSTAKTLEAGELCSVWVERAGFSHQDRAPKRQAPTGPVSRGQR
jgi:hypothetical protein